MWDTGGAVVGQLWDSGGAIVGAAVSRCMGQMILTAPKARQQPPHNRPTCAMRTPHAAFKPLLHYFKRPALDAA